MQRAVDCEGADCCEDGSAVLGGGSDTLVVPPSEVCLADLGGDDVLQANSQNQSLFAGPGRDTVMAGAGGVLLAGGDGDDVLYAHLTGSILIGGAGDDTLFAAQGDNLVIPGPGRDTVSTGTGDDAIVLADPCELAEAKTIDAGSGEDTLISPVPLSELQARGFTVANVEHVVVEANGCLSACREKPACVAGVCVESAAGSELLCECSPGVKGDTCDESDPPEFIPSVPPTLTRIASGDENAAVRDFLRWYALSRVGDLPAARSALDAVKADFSIVREMVAVVRDKTLDPTSLTEATAGLEIVAYLQCFDCEDLLIEVSQRPIPTTGEPVASDHGAIIGNRDELEALRLVYSAIHGLGAQGSERSRSTLLELVRTSASRRVRAAAAQEMTARYGDQYRSDLLALLPGDEQVEAYRFPSGVPDFNDQLRHFYEATQ